MLEDREAISLGKEETTKVYDTRLWAKSDDPLLSKNRTRICVSCSSKNTIIIYFDDSSSTTSDGWYWKEWTREFKCLDCGKYYEINNSETKRKFYTQ